MSIIVEQALPYSTTELKLEDPNRWSRLFPLMRPSIKIVEIAEEQIVVVDTSLSKSKDVLIAAIGSVGNLSSKILSKSYLAAFAMEQHGKPVSVEQIRSALKESGFPVQNGVVVVRSSSRQDTNVSAGIVELSVAGELKLDHILSLLSEASPEIKVSFEKIKELLHHVVKATARTTSKFHEKKIGKGPSVLNYAGSAEFNSAKSAVDKDLNHLLNITPSIGGDGDVVYSVHCSDINGLSRLENNILAHEISVFLDKKNLASRITHSTILDRDSPARGWAISLCIVPSVFLSAQPKPSNSLAIQNGLQTATKPRKLASKIHLSDSQVRKIITAGCERIIKEESTITEYDTIVGDGDCGYTLQDGAKQALRFIRNVDLSKLPSTLSDLVDDLEVNMGGTSGALYCIFLSALVQNLWDAPNISEALKGSLDQLLKYTRARLGDRTCLDCLIPFVETLRETNDPAKALAEAEKGVEKTKKLEAKLGRSSYLDEAATRGVPDPGAYGLLMLLEGMVSAHLCQF